MSKNEEEYKNKNKKIKDLFIKFQKPGLEAERLTNGPITNNLITFSSGENMSFTTKMPQVPSILKENWHKLKYVAMGPLPRSVLPSRLHYIIPPVASRQLTEFQFGNCPGQERATLPKQVTLSPCYSHLTLLPRGGLHAVRVSRRLIKTWRLTATTEDNYTGAVDLKGTFFLFFFFLSFPNRCWTRKHSSIYFCMQILLSESTSKKIQPVTIIIWF